MTAWERRVGGAFFALYISVFPFLIYGAVRIFGLEPSLTAAQSNAIYYAVVLVLLVAVFWDFLRHAGTILRDNLRASVFVFAMGLVAGTVLTCLAGCIPLPVENPAIETYRGEHYMAPGATWLVVALLRPAVEEILYRGLLNGSLRNRGRGLAYGVSTGLFVLSMVWQYTVMPESTWAYLLLAVQYLPLGLVQCWVYDVSGSVYTPIALRMALQAAFLLFALAA